MKLSEAIKLGAMTGPQVFGNYIEEGGGTCALGAALRAVGEPECLEEEQFPILDQLADCPECGPIIGSRVWDVVAHLNDDHRLTREAIADWVQTIEDAKPALQPEEAVVLG